MSFSFQISNPIILKTLKWTISVLSLVYLGNQFTDSNFRLQLHQLFLKIIENPFPIAFVLILLIPNIVFESWKWQIAMNSAEKINLTQSTKAILAGNAVSIFTPNRTGEYLGRMQFLKNPFKINAFFYTLCCGLAQLLFTIVLGLPGFIALFIQQHIKIHHWQIWIISIISILLIILLFLFVPLSKRILNTKILKKYNTDAIEIDSHVLTKILSISLSRYVVFFSQFYIILHVFGIQLSVLDSLIYIPSIFFLQTAIPTISLVDIGIRGAITSGVLIKIGYPESAAFISSFCIWIINLWIPAILGCIILIFSRTKS